MNNTAFFCIFINILFNFRKCIYKNLIIAYEVSKFKTAKKNKYCYIALLSCPKLCLYPSGSSFP